MYFYCRGSGVYVGHRDPTIGELLDYARQLEGLVRHASTHAAAVVIGRDPLVEWTPLFRVSEEEGATTQFEMDALKRVGIEKFDLLGLKTLTVLANALQAIERRHGRTLALTEIPQDDAPTYALLSRGETSAVFQLESSGMRKLVMDLQPSRIVDMLPLVALYRPGPIQTGELDRFVRRKQGKEKVAYFHPMMEPILEETFGVMVYQEQIMQIARDMGGFTLGQADILRSAMGKKKRDVMDRMRAVFVQGAVDRGITGEDASAIFDNMAEFAAYCFNKPHSAMYGIIAYYTAYLKTNYTAEFMAAQLTSFMDSKDRVALYIDEARRLGVQMRPPDINESLADFAVDSEGHIRFGLAAIKGVGRAAVQGILEAREGGPFSSLFDLCQRAPATAVNRAVLEALIRAGAFDRFGSRAAHLAILDSALSIRQQTLRERESGQESLFGEDDEESLTLGIPELPDIPELPSDELLEKEKELLGFYVSDNPLSKLAGRLQGRATHSASRLSGVRENEVIVVGGVVAAVRPYKTKNGKDMGFVTLHDHEGEISLVVFGEEWQRYGSLLRVDGEVLVKGKCQRREGSNRGEEILVSQVRALPEHKREPAAGAEPPAGGNGNGATYGDTPPPDEPPPPNGNGSPYGPNGNGFEGEIHVRIAGPDAQRILRGLRSLVANRRGPCSLVLHVCENGAERLIRLAEDYRVAFDEDFRLGLRALGLPAESVWTEATAGAA